MRTAPSSRALVSCSACGDGWRPGGAMRKYPIWATGYRACSSRPRRRQGRPALIDLISTAKSKDEADRNAPVALLSMGSFEQQGDYLPLATDTIIASIVTRELTDNDRVRSQSKLDRPRSVVIAVPTGPQPPSRAFRASCRAVAGRAVHSRPRTCARWRSAATAGSNGRADAIPGAPHRWWSLVETHRVG